MNDKHHPLWVRRTVVSKRELKGALVIVVASDCWKKSARLTVVGRGGVSQRIPPDDHGIDTHTGRRDTTE